ncbi:methyltransferase domain-containing protein [Micromonospora sp. WMMD1082]|uniref:class I SAM-dependent methyltransferase n=1 Tax=Micromonospora sp. WMMD1082 TaxID=3016104 RepID=UPI00241767B6|nr:methyltransferase domain-containing protein [Micromonospora sp. WMMD1082]MDG4793480.1 methyltransferase domain-containing protein [Micromonospora sp. WMMD1082]
MSVFRGAVGFYRQYRPGIPPTVAEVLDATALTGTPRRLLDVGTGTGLVVEALLGRFDDIIAIDNDADMLAAAEAALRPQLPTGTHLLLAGVTAEAFTPPAGWQADLVTICRAFHWLDQATVLARLDAQVSPQGAVAIFGDSSFWTATSDWKAAVRSVIQDFLGEQRRAGERTFQHHNRPYSDIMRESPFDQVEECVVPVTRIWTADSILGYLHSTSFAAPQLFGDRLDEFDDTIRVTLTRFSDTDTFPEDNEFLIRIGRRGRA